MSEIQKIAIIGGGNMGGAIAKGIVNGGLAEASQITVTRRNPDAIKAWAAGGYVSTGDNAEAVRGAQVIIFAVKPYQIADVIKSVKSNIAADALCISIATGVSIAQLVEMLGDGAAVVRVMPNTAAEVGESTTAIVGGPSTSKEQIELTEKIFGVLGKTFVVDEALMPALTALASCGIAHALRFIRAAQESGIEMGLTSKMAAEVVAQTVKGAAQLILTNHSHPEVEIDKVCTPKGVTITGINDMEHAGFTSAVMKGMMGSYNKIVK